MSRDYGWQSDEETRACVGCGQKVLLNAEGGVWFERHPTVRTWHVRCRTRGVDSLENGWRSSTPAIRERNDKARFFDQSWPDSPLNPVSLPEAANV